MSVEVSLKISHKYPKIVSSEDFTYFTLFGKNGDQLDNTIDNLGPSINYVVSKSVIFDHLRPLVVFCTQFIKIVFGGTPPPPYPPAETT